MRHVLAGLKRWLLRAAAAIGPEEKSEWLAAMLAEAESIEGPWEALRWALSAVFFACRCRILVAFGIVQENIMMSRASVAYIVGFLVVVGLLFTIPSFRDAAAMGPTTIKIAFGQTGLTDGELRRMSAKAEQRGDAAAMAFVAMQLEDSEQGMRLGKKAIAMNPSLAWIKYFIIYNSRRANKPRDMFGPELHEVIAADPDNALGYVLLASWLRRTDQSLSTHRAEWEAAMEKAFSARVYDDYLNRGLQLDREVIREHKASPFVAPWSMESWAFPDLLEIERYSNQLIASGDAQACARVVRFGDMMQSGQSDLEAIIGQYIRARALGVLEKKFDLALVAPKGPPPTRVPRNKLENLPFAVADAIVVQVALLVGGLAVLLVAGCAAALFLRRSKSAKLERLLRVAAITGVTAALVALLAYLPFTIAYSSYLQANTAQEAFAKIIPFAGFGFLPTALNGFFTTFQGHVYLWSLVILLGASIMVRRVVVHMQSARTRAA
jgi:hypothetical protein